MARTFHGIPTKHKGRQYRSRLEARWASFFDLVGWVYEYEPFDCNGWIPDFALTRTSSRPILVEVKPVNCFPFDVAHKIVAAAPEHETLIVGYTVPLGEHPDRPLYQLGWFYERRSALSPVHLIAEEELPLWSLSPDGRHGSREFREWVAVFFGRWHKVDHLWGPDIETTFGFCARDEYCMNEIGLGIGPQGMGDPDLDHLIPTSWAEAGNRTQWKAPC